MWRPHITLERAHKDWVLEFVFENAEFESVVNGTSAFEGCLDRTDEASAIEAVLIGTERVGGNASR